MFDYVGLFSGALSRTTRPSLPFIKILTESWPVNSQNLQALLDLYGGLTMAWKVPANFTSTSPAWGIRVNFSLFRGTTADTRCGVKPSSSFRDYFSSLVHRT